ncbi:kinesin-like protein KIN-14C isoform X2 [Iris pallida]|uniref:Kinesin-like protein KIN-14C isoform X2 n=1 Tax=Iris pallida TaxID=29817 RepID=A0AAX6EM69_IRIPA|nr:kinesin-like protein KIN-14C isoform X2 [Iris pallida]
MGSVNLASEVAKKQTDVIEWLNDLFPDFNLPPEASAEELRARLVDGSVLYAITRRTNPGLLEESWGGDYLSPRTQMEYLSSFLLVVNELSLPTFKVVDLELGPMAPVIACLLSLREHTSSSNGECRSQPLNRSTDFGGDRLENMDVSRGENTRGLQNTISLVEERKHSFPELRTRVLRSPLSSAPSSPLSHQVGHKFHETFQLNQGRHSDLPAAKILEMTKSNSLDTAPTQSLLSIVNGILDECIQRINGEIPQRVACLLRKLVQEIERRISTQAEHIQNKNNLIKPRKQKYLSRIRVLETLATGTSEETRIIINQLQLIKAEKDKVEEKKKIGDQDVIRLRKEKESSERKILELQQALETSKKSYEQQCQLLEAKASLTKVESEEKIKELESLLADSRKKTKELHALSESKIQTWDQKQHTFQSSIVSQLQLVKELRASSELIKHEVVSTKMRWSGELNSFGLKMKELTDAAENYHTVLAENRKLFNEVQELKGNIRVYCRIRPFLYGECKSSTTIDYIGENGELLLTNPSKQGKDGHRTYKFNKVFGPAATQEQVYLDIQPLVQSVLDGYNVCIFAYGQTGSGKTYTMTGPNLSSKEDWGVNCRALHDLFQISRDRKNNIMYEVGVQMVEIYNEQVRDLL